MGLFSRKNQMGANPKRILSPVGGRIATLESLEDGTFSKKTLGDGVVIEPTMSGKNIFYAPIAGEMTSVLKTGHAYHIRHESGVEVFIHIGINTVHLNGKGFKSYVKRGSKVKAGQKIAVVDMDFLNENVKKTGTILIVTSNDKIISKATEFVHESELLMELE